MFEELKQLKSASKVTKHIYHCVSFCQLVPTFIFKNGRS